MLNFVLSHSMNSNHTNMGIMHCSTCGVHINAKKVIFSTITSNGVNVYNYFDKSGLTSFCTINNSCFCKGCSKNILKPNKRFENKQIIYCN